MPTEGRVPTAVHQLYPLAQHDSCGRKIETGIRSRLAYRNLLGNAIRAIGIGDGKGYREGPDGGIESCGIGTTQLLHLSPGHTPLIGATRSLTTVDEAESVAGGESVGQGLEVRNRTFALLHCYFFAFCQLAAISISNRAGNIVLSGLWERQCYELRIES